MVSSLSSFVTPLHVDHKHHLRATQCAKNAKAYEKIYCTTKQCSTITNEDFFEFKLCNASFEIIHNRLCSSLVALGGHFNNMSILA